MDLKFKLGGTIGYGDSHLEYLICQSEALRLQAELHDAFGALRSLSGTDPGYCYMFGRGPNPCSFGHMTELLSCLYAKLFLPSISNSADFLCSLSCIVLDIQLADKNFTS